MKGFENISCDLGYKLDENMLRSLEERLIVKEFSLDVPNAYRWSFLIICILLLVGAFYFLRFPASPTSSSPDGSSSGSRGGSIPVEENSNLRASNVETKRYLDGARSELHSLLWWHVLGAVVLLGGLSLFIIGEPTPGKKIAGATLSVLGGLSLFPIKEFQVLGKLADKIEVSIPMPKPNPPAQEAEMQMLCTVEIFSEARADIDDPGVQSSLQACSDKIEDQNKKNWRIGFMFLVGHADKRNLTSPQRANWGSNEALANRRALAVKGYLVRKFEPTNPGLESHIIVASSGAGNTGLEVSTKKLAEDRAVAVHAHWVHSP